MIAEIMSETRAELAAEVEGLDVHVTTKATEAVSVVNSGGIALVVPPPSITPETFTHWVATFDLWLLVGTPDPDEATTRLSPVIEALVPLGATEALPDSFETGGSLYSGYRVTLRNTYQKET